MKHFLRMLGAEDDATWPQIRESYKQQVKVWHPDRFLEDEKLHKKAEEKTKEIHYALRRLEELKNDLGEHFDPQQPFLKQYAKKTNGGKGPHGKATIEDRRMGYMAESFGNWNAVGSSLSDSIHRGAKIVVQAAIAKAPVRPRRRTTTIQRRSRKPKRASVSGTYFLIGFGLTMVFSTIGAYNVLQLLPEPHETRPSQISKKSEREILKMILSEPAPSSEKNLDATARLKLANQRSIEKRPMLINAAMECKTKLTAKLLRQGEDIDVADSLGQTPLIWAAKRNCSNVAKLLLERKADPFRRSKNGFTALRWAEWYRNSEIIKVLEKYQIKS